MGPPRHCRTTNTDLRGAGLFAGIRRLDHLGGDRRRQRLHLRVGQARGVLAALGMVRQAGTGLAYHTQRRKNASGLTDSEMEALSAPVTSEVVESADAGEESSAS